MGILAKREDLSHILYSRRTGTSTACTRMDRPAHLWWNEAGSPRPPQVLLVTNICGCKYLCRNEHSGLPRAPWYQQVYNQ